MKLKHIIILQNKIDLVRESQAKEQYQQIKKFVEGAVYSLIETLGSPIVDGKHIVGSINMCINGIYACVMIITQCTTVLITCGQLACIMFTNICLIVSRLL